MSMSRFEVHAHDDYSNIRLVDCINKPEKLIDRAIENGLSGISITDHECLAAHIQVNQYAKKIYEKHPDFKIALGNEIYLTGSRESGQKYYHFILIAKNKTGHRALRELSSRAWMNSYYDRRMERVVTLYDDLKEIVTKYPNSLIATTACLGGELSQLTLNLIKAENQQDAENINFYHQRIVNFILFCKELFNDDFYIECAPGQSKEQIAVNKRFVSIANCFGIKMVIGTDAHYLKKEDRFIHKAYLNSKDGDREVDDFYEYSYLQTEEEIQENLKPSNLSYEELVHNSYEIYEKIERYSLEHNQTIPKVEVEDFPKCQPAIAETYPTLSEMFASDNQIDRYWVNKCVQALGNKNLLNDTYLARLEEEAETKKVISNKLGTNMFGYPVTLQHYVNMFWECGSIVGAGRGSSCSGLNHYLLGITQLDPIKWSLPFWRYLNKERIELGSLQLILPSCKKRV